MTKGNTTENDVLKCVLKGTDPSWRTNARLYVALHTGDPTETGGQNSSETSYSQYARQPIIKVSGWTDSGSSFTNAAQIQFPICGTTGATLTHVSIGISSTVGSTGQILYSGSLNDNLTVSKNIQPQFQIGALEVQED